MSNGNDPAAAAGRARATGFIQQTSRALAKHHERLDGINGRLNELGGRLIGVDQLPRNQREVAAKSTTDAPEAVKSDSEQVQYQVKRLDLMIDELGDIVGFLEQL